MTTARQSLKIPAPTRPVTRLVLLIAALAMILVGIFVFGELDQVAAKASYLCYECIGIG